MSVELHLDAEIRDKVLLPIVFVVAISTLLRSNVSRILGQPQPRVDLEEVSRGAFMQRLGRMKSEGDILTSKNWKSRKTGFLATLSSPPTQKSAMESLMAQHQDPSMTMNMLVNQVTFIALHGTLGYWISHMFSGFLVAKLPFPLTHTLKQTFQRGVEVENLPSAYVSSLSFYILVSVAVSGLIEVARRALSGWSVETEGEEQAGGVSAQMELAMMGTGMAMPPPQASMGQTDVKKLFETEKENLDVHVHRFKLDDVEAKLLKQWRA